MNPLAIYTDTTYTKSSPESTEKLHWFWERNTWNILGKLLIHTPESRMGFPGGASGKESFCQCRRRKRRGFNPWVGKIPWRRARQPTPVFLPGKSQDRGAWQAIVHRVEKSQIRLRQLSTQAHTSLTGCAQQIK